MTLQICTRLTLIALALSCGGRGLAATKYRIAVAGPFSGAYAVFGEQMWHGAERAAADLNKNGGINGKLVELIKADDACEPKQAVTVASRLINKDKVHAVIGHFCSSAILPASELYEDADILAITPAATNPQITERRLATVMRTCGRDDQQGAVAADFIAKHIKAKSTAIIHDKDTYGRGLADATRARLKQLGVGEVLYEGLSRGEKDFNALVTKIKSSKADVVYFGGQHSEAGALVRQMREQGLKTPFVSGDAIASTEFAAAAGGAKFVEGVYLTFGADPRQLESGKAVADAFRKAGYEPESYTLYAYATMQSIAQALKATGKTSGKGLAKWLKANTVETVMGPKSWDEKGDLKVSDYVVYVWDNSGKYAEVKL